MILLQYLMIIVNFLLSFSYKMTNTTVEWKDLNSLYSNCWIPFSQLLYLSFYTKMRISKLTIIIKYWRNTANYEIYIHFYLLKLPACGFKVPKTISIDVEYEMQHSHISLLVPDHLCASAGFLQINLCTKPILRVTLQIKF